MLIIESIIVGFLSLVIGNIFFYKLNTKEEFKSKKKKLPKISIIFFVIGFFIHIVLEKFSFNKIYCDKQCRAILKNFKLANN